MSSVSLIDGHIDNDTSGMTDNEIIKALEVCHKCVYGSCPECPLHGVGGCDSELMKYALNLIKRQKAEIERLEKIEIVFDEIEDTINPLPFETDYDKAVKQAKAEAIKEFAERLKEKERPTFPLAMVVDISEIDNLVKEMVGDTE